jgi:hypothetical protein
VIRIAMPIVDSLPRDERRGDTDNAGLSPTVWYVASMSGKVRDGDTASRRGRRSAMVLVILGRFSNLFSSCTVMIKASLAISRRHEKRIG